jgi:hypothetical protein
MHTLRSGTRHLPAGFALAFLFLLGGCQRNASEQVPQINPQAAVQASSGQTTLRDTLGMSVGLDADIAQIAQYGFTRLRTDFTWKDIQRSASAIPSQWNWGPHDNFVNTARSHGMSVLAILDYGNPWANADPCNRADDKRPPDDFATFTNYAVETVKHFDGRISQYEVWNEPNNLANWKHGQMPNCTGGPGCFCQDSGVDDAGAFGRLTSQTIDAVNRLTLGAPPRIAPGATIYLTEPINRSGNDYMTDAFNINAGLAQKLTAQAIHAYNAYPPHSPPEDDGWDQGTTNVQLGSKIAQARNVYVSHGMSASQPLWITEVGWPTINGVDYVDQAKFTVRTILLSALNGAQQVYLFNFKDNMDASFCNADHGLNPFTYGDAEHCFGLFYSDGTPKQAASAVQYLMQRLGDYSVVGRVPVNDPNHSVYLIQLSNGTDTCYAAWDWLGDKGYNWTVPNNFGVWDMMGNQLHVGTQVRLNDVPYYSCQLPAPQPRPDTVFGCNYSGQPMESFGGVMVYCDDPAASGEWQCDQFANRVMSSLSYPPVDNWVDNLACQICDLVANDASLSAHYSVWGPGYRTTAGHQPGRNDLLVWWEPSGGCNITNKNAPGHIAVVTGADSNYVYYIQQNWMVNESINGSAYAAVSQSSTAWNSSTSFFSYAGGPGGGFFAPKCWIHPEQSLGPGHNPCINVSHANNGQFCGTENQSGFLNHSLNPNTDPNTLYECVDGQVANERHCVSGCVQAPPGVDDYCATNDPCSAVPSIDNGFFCGGTNQFGFNPRTADPGGLYHCVDHKTVEYAFCWNGCQMNGGGIPDSCMNDACANVPASANGTYCGSNPQSGFQSGLAEQSTLYTCRNGKTVDSAFCNHGCTPNPIVNQPDVCNLDPCANVPAANNGIYCGRTTQTGFATSLANPGAIYECQNGVTLWAQSCQNGCFLAPSGQDDGCR